MNDQIAVIGYACRVPGASNVDDLWDIVVNGRDAVTRASTNVGATSGDRVHAYGVLPGVEQFDEEFFGYSPREAADIDPQQRLLLECAVEALESACVRLDRLRHEVGVYASVGLSSYLLNTWSPASGADALPALFGGDGHYAATRIAYKLGLTGPAMLLGSACSSSLLAVHMAAQAILMGDCDVALAGGMDVEVPQPMSYLYQAGGILSHDGVCRPFDKRASGTVFGSGGGMVALASLEVAEENGWPVQAVLLGSAANNDGAAKASFTAPRASRQADVIGQALAVAGVAPSQVAYLECHGTGTQLGDRSELGALRDVFGEAASLTIGSAKANFGHMRVGAGVVGFIKACETVRRAVLPPCANLEQPIDVAGELRAQTPLAATPAPIPSASMVAGISSFGFGGTNVHTVIRGHASAQREFTAETNGPILVKVSATGPDSCLATAARLASRIRVDETIDVSDVADTLDRGRPDRPYRYAVVAADRDSLVRGLENVGPDAIEGWSDAAGDVLILLPGQGSNLLPLARGLNGWEEVFTRSIAALWAELRTLDATAPTLDEALRPSTRLDLASTHALHAAVELAVVDQLTARGLQVIRFAGYSLGEYAAAAAAGVLTGSDAVALAYERGRLLATAPSGDMIAVQAGLDQLAEVVPDVAPAIAISPGRYVLAVTADCLDDVRRRLTEARIGHRELGVGIPYHSPALTSIAAPLSVVAARITHRPDARFVPTAAGAAHGTPEYWTAHLTRPVDFSRVAATASAMASVAGCHVIDLSPDGFLARAVTDGRESVIQTVRMADGGRPVRTGYLLGLAQLWVQGVEIDLATPTVGRRRFVTLPGRSFERRRHFKELAAVRPVETTASRRTVRRERSLDRWAYYPSWRMKRREPTSEAVAGQRWLVFADADDLGLRVVAGLREQGVDCVQVCSDEVPAVAGAISVRAGDEASLKRMVAGLDLNERPIDRILHLWCGGKLTDGGDLDRRLRDVEQELTKGFYAILYTIQEMSIRQGARRVRLDVVGRGIHPLVANCEDTIPARALLLGPALVIPQDFPFMSARTVDIGGLADVDGQAPVEQVLAEIRHPARDKMVTFGQGARWVRCYERDVLPTVESGRQPMRLRDRGVYLITGGLGGIGMTLAEYLVRTCRARLVLTGLEAVPDQALWEGDRATLLGDPLLAERVARIRKLVDLGGEVVAARCDAADVEQTTALFQLIDARFGGLDGVVHAAGVFETQRAFRGLEDTSREDCVRRLRPKVDGTLVLAELLRGRVLDFVLMQSSLSAQLGGLGFYAYTAGNAFMDAFAERHRTKEIPWMSVNWDGWIFRERDDDTHNSVISPSFASPDFGVVAEIAVRPSEGAEIYAKLMQLDEPHQVLISTADFETRVDQWVKLPISTDAGDPVVAAAVAGYESCDEVEAEVARIWREILGSEEIRPDSNFFALGGDSLLGVALAFHLSHACGVVLSVITMFDNPTVSAMAAEIRRLGGRRVFAAQARGEST